MPIPIRPKNIILGILISPFNTVSSRIDSDIPITAAFVFDAIIFTSSIYENILFAFIQSVIPFSEIL